MNNDTTYSMGISADKGAMGVNRNLDDRKHLHGSINLGTNQVDYLSEAKSK